MAMAAAALLIILLATPAVHAVQHTVGGSSGWSQSTNYATWASGETFTVGDTLLFSYTGLHSVDQVSQNDYNNCNSGNALNSYSGGQTTISLDNPGPMYFMCPTVGHCQGGMKLAITVAAAAGGGGATPSTGTSPATPTTPSGSNNPITTPATSTPATSSGGAAANFGNTNHVMIGLSLVVAALVAFMG